MAGGFAAGVAGLPAAGQGSAQSPSQSPGGASRPQQPTTDDNSSPPGLESPDKRLLESNEKDIKKKVEQLYDLATQLKNEVEKTDSSKVLNLSLVKKAEEIERLARDIKNRSKG